MVDRHPGSYADVPVRDLAPLSHFVVWGCPGPRAISLWSKALSAGSETALNWTDLGGLVERGPDDERSGPECNQERGRPDPDQHLIGNKECWYTAHKFHKHSLVYFSPLIRGFLPSNAYVIGIRP